MEYLTSQASLIEPQINDSRPFSCIFNYESHTLLGVDRRTGSRFHWAFPSDRVGFYKRYRRMLRGLTPGLNPIGRYTNH